MPLVSEVPHPTWRDRSYHDANRRIKHYTRTDHPVRYYIIDFGLALQFAPGEPCVASAVYGGDKSVPEYRHASKDSECNPFCVDIYTLGNMIRTKFMQVWHFCLQIPRFLIRLRLCRKVAP